MIVDLALLSIFSALHPCDDDLMQLLLDLLMVISMPPERFCSIRHRRNDPGHQ